VTTPTLRLLTLGTLDLLAPDGSELRSVLAQPRRIALLAYLALATPRGPHRRDRLLALFWPDQDQAHARNALSQAVYFLRNSLGADAVVSRTAEELALDMSTVWCDAIAFDEALDARRYVDAVELYRGELLAGFHVAGAAPDFAAWLDTMRATYARRY
jgi:DNA-binding SARP family transcriptional activator